MAWSTALWSPSAYGALDSSARQPPMRAAMPCSMATSWYSGRTLRPNITTPVRVPSMQAVSSAASVMPTTGTDNISRAARRAVS
jgi:hypothetical protein